MSSDPVKSIAQRFFGFCILILFGVIAIWIAFEVLARIWGWIVLVAVIGALGYAGFVLIQRRRSRW